jgi:hypothetical protein
MPYAPNGVPQVGQPRLGVWARPPAVYARGGSRVQTTSSSYLAARTPQVALSFQQCRTAHCAQCLPQQSRKFGAYLARVQLWKPNNLLRWAKPSLT